MKSNSVLEASWICIYMQAQGYFGEGRENVGMSDVGYGP
jgi:hypothetical protein